MGPKQTLTAAILSAALGLVGFGPAVPSAAAAETAKLSVFAAGTLAVPFRALDQVFEKKYGGVEVQPQFGGSVKMAKQITELHEPADILAVADYNVIPKYMFGSGGQFTLICI